MLEGLIPEFRWNANALIRPSAADGRNQISDIGDDRARSALSFQRSAS